MTDVCDHRPVTTQRRGSGSRRGRRADRGGHRQLAGCSRDPVIVNQIIVDIETAKAVAAAQPVARAVAPRCWARGRPRRPGRLDVHDDLVHDHRVAAAPAS